MDTITRDELKALSAPKDAPCVSLYLPLHRRYPHTHDNAPELAGLLDEAEQRLADNGSGASDVRRFLQPARKLVESADFWKPTSAKGLAVLLACTDTESPTLKTYHLPYSVPESVDVGNRFHITPLIALLDWNARFYLLAMGLNSVRLYACDHAQAEQIGLPSGVPTSFAEFTAGTDVGKPIQFRSSTGAGAAGDQIGLVHGQTSYKDEHKFRVDEFISHIAKQVNHWLTGRSTPVVLAAVDHYHPVFHKACSYRALVPEGVHGSPDELTEHELHERAAQCVSHWQADHLADFNGHYTSRLAHGHASSEVESIVPAAKAGRVETLLVAEGTRILGPVRSGLSAGACQRREVTRGRGSA